MQDKLDIHLLRFAAQRPNGVGAHRWALLGAQATAGILPGAVLGQLRWLAIRRGEENLDALIGGQAVHLRDILTAEDETRERRAERDDGFELNIEQAVGAGFGGFACQLAQTIAQGVGQ
ncbi:hypothetical protein D3C85_1371760 [compost metagenome]